MHSDSIITHLSKWVLSINHRNGGNLERLDLALPLMDSSLLLDSLDLAEIMVAVEQKYGISPFESATPPKTWQDLAGICQRAI